MPGTNTVAVIAESLARAVEPLEFALRSPESFEAFMLRLGWTTSTFIPSVQNLGGTATELLRLASEGTSADEAPRTIALLVKFFDDVKNLGSTGGLPDTIDSAEFGRDFPPQLRDFLIADYLLHRRLPLGAILLAGGVITRTRKPAAGRRPPYERFDVAWNAVGNLLHDALATVRNAYGWGTQAFAEQAFVDNMVTLGEALGCDVFSHSIGSHLKTVLNEGAASTTALQDEHVRWRMFTNREGPSAVELGLDLFVLPRTASAQPGIAVAPYAAGLGGATLDIGDALSVSLKGAVDISNGVLVSIRPQQPIAVRSDLLTGGAGPGGEFSATVQSRGEGGARGLLLGSEAGSRFEYGSVSLTVGARLDAGVPAFYAEAAILDGQLVISPGAEADGFVTSLAPSELRIDANPTVGFDSTRGVYFAGGAGLELEIPAHVGVGPVDVVSGHIAVNATGGSVPVALGVTLRGTLGPLVAQVDNVGLIVELSFPGADGNVGPLNAALTYKAPSGVALSIDGAAVGGGGYLHFDAHKREYTGILELEIAETIAVSAIGLLVTQMPGGARGYSLLIVITAEGFAPIQLGYGFTLTGIGGLLAINRTFDEEALRAGLKAHALDSVMFPADPVRNAAQIVSSLNRVFPPAAGHHLFGPMAQISWGTPTLITADLGVVLELGARLRLLILGQVVAVLPGRENELIRLQMDAVGVLDFDRGTASLDASLYDSRLLNRFVLTGDMAMRMNWEGSPNFALAIGGLHPAFNPPPNFPKLERVAINLSAGDNPRIRCESYFALTANTVQFGARAELYAAASGFSIHGEIGYDVLIQLDPFAFLADFYAQLQLKRGSTNLFKVRVEGALAGPRPLHIKGKATFEVLWMDVTIRIDKTLVQGERPPRPAPIDVLPRLREALAHPGNWTGGLPSHQRPLVTLRPAQSAGADVVLHPLGTLTIKQTIVPLDLEISRFGQTTPSGARRFTISSVSVGGVNQPKQSVRDFFAPAQFVEMSDDEKLSRPSFEQLTAGVSVGSHEIVISTETDDWLEVEAIAFETITIDPGKGESRRSSPDHVHALTTERLDQQARFGAAARSAVRRTGRARYRTARVAHRVVKEGWSLVAPDLSVHPVPGVEPGRAASYSEAAQALGRMTHEQPAIARGLKIMRLSELMSEPPA